MTNWNMFFAELRDHNLYSVNDPATGDAIILVPVGRITGDVIEDCPKDAVALAIDMVVAF